MTKVTGLVLIAALACSGVSNAQPVVSEPATVSDVGNGVADVRGVRSHADSIGRLRK